MMLFGIFFLHYVLPESFLGGLSLNLEKSIGVLLNFIFMRVSLREKGVSKSVLSVSFSGSGYCRNWSGMVGHIFSAV